MAAAKKKTARGRKQDPGPRGQWAGLRSPLRSEEDRPLGIGREEGRQEGRQFPQARRETSSPLGRL